MPKEPFKLRASVTAIGTQWFSSYIRQDYIFPD